MSVVRCRVLHGFYTDSVRLMRLQSALAALPGVEDAGAMMGGAVNLSLLAEAGLLPESARASASDVLISVRAGDEESARAALARVESLLDASSAASVDYRARSLEVALKTLPECNLVAISVAGRFAAALAEEAIERRRHVFLFSDNVGIEDEVRLKQKAARHGLLLMGPDCGTALLHGVGLGFSNRVEAGPIGLVSASGSGVQAVAAALARKGIGISVAFGCGSRDLSDAVGGLTTIQALHRLERDDSTRVIVMISKPPSPEVATRVLAAARSLTKPVVVDFLGQAPPARRIDNLHFASTLEDAARIAARLPGESVEPAAPDTDGFSSSQKLFRGLFSGGTLAQEGLLSLGVYSARVESNLTGAAWPGGSGDAHWILDLGDDEFTQGRLHPMLDNRLRVEMLLQQAKDPRVAVVVLDVVLGDGSHPDPAGDLAPAVHKARLAASQEGRRLEVIVILVGTGADPQGLDNQASAFRQAGARVEFDCQSGICRAGGLICALSPESESPEAALQPLPAPLRVVNVGLEVFYESLLAQEAEVLQVDWRPPAGGDDELALLLSKMK